MKKFRRKHLRNVQNGTARGSMHRSEQITKQKNKVNDMNKN